MAILVVAHPVVVVAVRAVEAAVKVAAVVVVTTNAARIKAEDAPNRRSKNHAQLKLAMPPSAACGIVYRVGSRQKHLM